MQSLTSLPTFRYHPDPLATGSIAESTAVCRSCHRATGYVYTGPVYAEEELAESLCPWCIADGSAASRFDAEFTDPQGIGDNGRWDAVPTAVVEEVVARTPGFSGWQQERWWTHCGDAAQYLGRAGRAELLARWPTAVDVLRDEAGLKESEWDDYLANLDAEGSPTAYVFKCRHCARLGGYSDSD